MTGRLIDTTLREGSQALVRYLTDDQRQALLAGLLRIGVEEIELGHAVAESAYDPEPLADLIDLAADLAPDTRRAVWCRARRDDILAAAELEPDVVSFALPVSDLHLERRLGRGREWALAQPAQLTELARRSGVEYVSIGLEDATRADPDFLDQVVAAVAAAGADRVRIADTVGICHPGELTTLVKRVRRSFPGEIAVHLHDDFGMASGSAVAALQAGADWADVSVTGLGERAGIARTEEVAGWLAIRGGADYDLLAARQVAHQVAGWVGREIADHAPVVGEKLFACESGLHLAGLARDPATYEPYPPDLVGASRQWQRGRGAGREAVAALAPDLDHNVVEATARVRRAAANRSRALHPSEWGEVLRLADRQDRP